MYLYPAAVRQPRGGSKRRVIELLAVLYLVHIGLIRFVEASAVK